MSLFQPGSKFDVIEHFEITKAYKKSENSETRFYYEYICDYLAHDNSYNSMELRSTGEFYMIAAEDNKWTIRWVRSEDSVR